MLCKRKGLITGGKNLPLCPEQRSCWMLGSCLWVSLSMSIWAPFSETALWHPLGALLAISQKSKATNFLLWQNSSMKKRKWQRTASASMKLKAEELKAFGVLFSFIVWNNMEILVYRRIYIAAQRAQVSLTVNSSILNMCLNMK